MASACVHGREEDECSACKEVFETELTIQMSKLTVDLLNELSAVASESNDIFTQCNCTLAMGYVLRVQQRIVTEAATDAAREIAILLMAEK